MRLSLFSFPLSDARRLGIAEASVVRRAGRAHPGSSVWPRGYTENVATIETADATVLSLTERAAGKVRMLMAEEPAGEAEVLRVAIRGGGCGGFEYALGFDRGAADGDSEAEFHGVRVVVDPASAPYLRGAT